MTSCQWRVLLVSTLMALLISSHAQQADKATPTDTTDNQMALDDQHTVQDKRNWNRLQGVWGKRQDRADQDVFTNEDIDQEQSAWSDFSQRELAKKNWNKLQGVWGKRSSHEGAQPKRKWNQLTGVWGKRSYDIQDDPELAFQDLSPEEKRAWNQLQGVWGKRADDQADLIDADTVYTDPLQDLDELEQVKRAWNQLRGAWGKRAWNDLRGSWGKREVFTPKGKDWNRKREMGWNNLKGLWG